MQFWRKFSATLNSGNRSKVGITRGLVNPTLNLPALLRLMINGLGGGKANFNAFYDNSMTFMLNERVSVYPKRSVSVAFTS